MTNERAKRFLSAKTLSVAVILLTLAILGATVLFAHLYLRGKIREQIARTHAEILHHLWLSQKFEGESQDAWLGADDDPADQLHTILETSQLPQLKGVLVTRLFNREGKFIIPIPPSSASASDIGPQDFLHLKNLQPISHFRPSAKLADLFPLEPSLKESPPLPLLEISIPLHSPDDTRLLGVAQFVLDGKSVAAEFHALDYHLASLAVLVFILSGTILGAGLGFAFRQLHRVNALLTERTRSLLHANQELTLAAKTSAVGAVTAHLIHGLKNPLSGLHHFMSNRESAPAGGSDSDWQLALSTTRRMQSLVSEIVRVLREENSVSYYEISLQELGDLISAHMSPVSKEAGVQFHVKIAAEGLLSNRDGNLIILILENLIHNAIQATPKEKSVTLAITASGHQALCEVRDEGPGLSESARQSLFEPCRSTKEGGTGIGLAISKQLASHIGAELELNCNEPGRCIFALVLPSRVLSGQSQLAISNELVTTHSSGSL